MSPISNVSASPSPLIGRLDAPNSLKTPGLTGTPSTPVGEGFGQLLDGLVSTVGTKQAEARAATQSVLLGETDQVHQSIIAMQEASVAFSLMVEVRNKLVESYQELMRMQV